MLDLDFAMTYRLTVGGPLASTDGSPESTQRQYWEMKEATLEGPDIRAATPMGGIDWFTPLGGGYGRPHVRLPFMTNDGALVLMEYGGIVHATDAFVDAVATDKPTEWGDQYMRMAISFETTSPAYAWLVQSLFVARGRLLGAKSLEYEVFRVR